MLSTVFPNLRRTTWIHVVCVLVLGVARASAQIQFSGVAAGDASSSEAIVWTRAVDPIAPAATILNLEVSVNDPTFTSGVTTFSVSTDPLGDYTAKHELVGLQANTRYYYRFSAMSVTSIVGTFKTAPSATSAERVRFAFSGDCDGLMRPYPLASVVPAMALDYFIFLGDTMYENVSAGSPGVTLSGTIPAPTATGATQAQLFNDYSKKYREQFIPVNVGGQNCLQSFFAGQGNYTLLDNHELGNRQYINGGAAAGGTVGGMPNGAGVDARQPTNDVNTSTSFINKSLGFQTLQQVFMNYQPIKERGNLSVPTDPRTDGTRRLYFAQDWGKNAIFINVDDRSYRDIRMKTAANADETTSPRADNPNRTMLGATQLQWLQQTLLAAQTAGTIWKFIAISSPIDQLGPIGGALPIPGVNADGGKSWMGGYRAERNALLKFIADNHIYNVVFLSTDDHQNRINELLYSPSGQTDVQSSYRTVPHCFSIVDGPLGATGPDTITNHSIANIQSIGTVLATAQINAGLDPMGLHPLYPGLKNLVREGHPSANLDRQAWDFYSPDTFNLALLDVSPDGSTLSVGVYGINSTPANSFLEYDAIGNPARQIMSFDVDAFLTAPATPSGQANSPCATLLVNGAGANRQGPIDVTVPAGTPLEFSWFGAPNQPLALVLTSAFQPGQVFDVGVIVDIDLNSFFILFNGFDPFSGLLFKTGPNGATSQSFIVPVSAAGFTLNVQGAVWDLAGVCTANVGYATTSSFAIHF